MRILLILLWWFGIFDDHSVWNGWFWPLMGGILMPRLTMTLALWRMFPQHGTDSIWITAMVLMGLADMLYIVGGSSDD